MKNHAQTASCLTLLLLAALLVPATAEEDRFAERLAKAEASNGGKRAQLYADLARDYVEAASEHFDRSEFEAGQAAVRRAVECATEAGDTARQTRKRLKKTEISLRKMARRLDDIKRTLSFEHRPVLEAAVEQLETVRREILSAMFTPKKERS